MLQLFSTASIIVDHPWIVSACTRAIQAACLTGWAAALGGTCEELSTHFGEQPLSREDHRLRHQRPLPHPSSPDFLKEANILAAAPAEDVSNFGVCRLTVLEAPVVVYCCDIPRPKCGVPIRGFALVGRAWLQTTSAVGVKDGAPALWRAGLRFRRRRSCR